MNDTQQTIPYWQYTKLKVNLFQKAEKMNPILEVFTPHKGAVIIELHKVDKGFFRKATELPKETQEVIKELYKLEREAKDYLLDQWLSPSNEK